MKENNFKKRNYYNPFNMDLNVSIKDKCFVKIHALIENFKNIYLYFEIWIKLTKSCLKRAYFNLYNVMDIKDPRRS